jgi:hypothetical protein
MTVGDSALVTCCLHRLRSARPLWVRPGGVCFSAVRCLPGGTGKGIGERLFLGPKTVSNLERGINRTAHKDTAVLLAGALGLTGPAEELFVAAARGHVPPAQVLAAAGAAGSRPGAVTVSPYRGLAAFEEQDAAWSSACSSSP